MGGGGLGSALPACMALRSSSFSKASRFFSDTLSDPIVETEAGEADDADDDDGDDDTLIAEQCED